MSPGELQAWRRAWVPLAPAGLGGWSEARLGPWRLLIREGRAFSASCPHRGFPLAPADPLRCPYHGWRFGPDGACLHGEAGLLPVASGEAFGILWGAVEPELPLEAWLAPVAPWLARLDGAWTALLRTELACDWKLGVDVHLEGLHVPWIHAEIAALVRWDEARIERRGPHGHLAVRGLPPVGDVDLLHVFPGLAVNLHARGANLFLTSPTGAGRCRMEQWTRGAGPAAAWPPREVRPDDPGFGPVTGADLRVAEALAVGAAEGLGPPRFTPAEALLAGYREELRRRGGAA